MNLYADVGVFERRFLDSQRLDADDLIEGLRTLGAASRAVDGFCRRVFYAETATRYLRGSGRATLELDRDLISVSAVNVDSDDDRSYDVTLAEGTDYELSNIDDEDDDQPPYSGLVLLTDAEISVWPRRRRAVEIVGRWGYSADVLPLLTSAGVAVTGTLTNATDTTLATSGAAAPAIAPGMTLRIGSEDVYVRHGSASPYIVDRGVNGTTAATHSAAALSRYTYPADITEAVLVQTGRLWKRKDSPMLPSIIAAPGLGDMQLIGGGLDPDVQTMIARLKRFSSP